MGLVKDNFVSVSEYNRLPFIEEVHHVAENYKEDVDYLCCLLKKHGLPPSVCLKLIHIHFHLNEGEIMAFTQFSAPPHGRDMLPVQLCTMRGIDMIQRPQADIT